MRRWIGRNWTPTLPWLLPLLPLLVSFFVPEHVQGWVMFGVIAVQLPFLVRFAVRAFRRERGDRRFYGGKCLHCGYSLAGNVSGVCPECGTRAGKVG